MSEKSRKERTPRTEKEENLLLRRYVVVSLIGLFVFDTICTMSCIFFIGFGMMKLSNMLLHYLMTHTIGQGAAIFLFVARSLFPVKAGNGKGRK